jgi:hypothetical protein
VLSGRFEPRSVGTSGEINLFVGALSPRREDDPHHDDESMAHYSRAIATVSKRVVPPRLADEAMASLPT